MTKIRENKKSFINIKIILLIILIILMLFIAYKIIKQEKTKPYGYYDGTYICINQEDYKNNLTPKRIIEDHEYCHSLVKGQYEHFCDENRITKIFNR